MYEALHLPYTGLYNILQLTKIKKEAFEIEVWTNTKSIYGKVFLRASFRSIFLEYFMSCRPVLHFNLTTQLRSTLYKIHSSL